MVFITSHVVPVDQETVWQWHTKQGAVARLTPPFYPLTPLRQATDLATGSTVYSLPAGLRWEARHDLSGYVRGHQFTDVCVNAPMRILANWRHTHTFTTVNLDGQLGTRITDEVRTRVPKASLAPLFAYRQHQLTEDLAARERFHHFATTPLRIGVTGSRGLVGRALTAQLQTLGHQVVQLVRDNLKPGQRLWQPYNPDPELLTGLDLVVHLAGEPFFGRFNDSHKKALRETRIEPTQKLAQLVADSPTCHTMISSSTIGFYGVHRNHEALDESAEKGEGFLADLAVDWEQSCQPAIEAGKRVVILRSGVILSGRGGILPVLRNLFSTGLGGRFADAEAWFSWIAIDDLTDIIITAAVDSMAHGVFNAVAPQAVTNQEIAKILGKQLRRPARFPFPALGTKMLFGSQGTEDIVLADQKITPRALLSRQHHFRYPEISAALSHELGTESLFDASTSTLITDENTPPVSKD